MIAQPRQQYAPNEQHWRRAVIDIGHDHYSRAVRGIGTGAAPIRERV